MTFRSMVMVRFPVASTLTGLGLIFCLPTLGVAQSVSQSDVEQRPEAQVVSNTAPDTQALISGTSLIGASILDRTGQSSGTVDRVTLDAAGRTVHLIVNVGGVLGIGAKEIAIPLAAIRLRTTKQADDPSVWLSVDATGEQLKNSAPLEARESLELTDSGWIEKNARYFGIELKSQLPSSATEPLKVLTASQIIGHSVVGQGDTATIAQVEDLLFGFGTEPVEYVILSYGGTLGLGQQYVALPFRELTIQTRAEEEIQIAVPHNSKTLSEQQHVTPTGYPELKLRSVRVRIENSN